MVHFRYICVLVCSFFTSVYVMPGSKGSTLPPLYIAAEEVLAHDAELYEAFAKATGWVRASGTPTSAQRAEMRRLILKVQAAALPQPEKEVVTRFLQQASKRRLSAGAAAGIAVGGIATIAALVMAAQVYRQKHKRAGGASEDKRVFSNGLTLSGPSDVVATYSDHALQIKELPAQGRVDVSRGFVDSTFACDHGHWKHVFAQYNGPKPPNLHSAVGICEVQGARSEMQDAVGCFEIAPRRFGLCVADGHGGDWAPPLARIVSQRFLRMFGTQNITSELARTLSAQLDNSFRRQYNGWLGGGTTFTGAVVDVNVNSTVRAITLVNLGDSRCVVFDDSGRAVAQTEDHSPHVPSEEKRITDAGGQVHMYMGKSRVYDLAVSRAFGDFEYDLTKKLVSNEAEVVSVVMSTNPHWIVIGCDGLWDNLTAPEVGAFLLEQQGSTVQDLTERCTQQAYQKSLGDGVRDNISVVIVDLTCIGTE